MEPDLPFRVTAPPSGRVELVARPPHVWLLVLAQALFAALAVLLFRRIARAAAPES